MAAMDHLRAKAKMMTLVRSSEAKRGGNGRFSPTPSQITSFAENKRHNESHQMSTLEENSVMRAGLGLRKISRDSLATLSVSHAPRLINLQALIDREIILDTLV